MMMMMMMVVMASRNQPLGCSSGLLIDLPPGIGVRIDQAFGCLGFSDPSSCRPQEPMNPTLKGVAYVSVWVLLWGTAASIADAVLLERGAYATGTAGQAVTFASYGLAAVVLAVRLAGRFLKPEA